MQKPTPIASRLIHHGSFIDLSVETLRYANGREHRLDYIRHPGASAVVVVDDAGRACFVRQYRHGIQDFLWEIPAGKLDAGERPDACAVRELAEETGVTAQRWDYLGTYFPAAGIFTEVIHLYLARQLTLGHYSPDPDEELEIAWVPFEEALDRVRRGEWSDGKTALALLRAQPHLQL